MRVDRDAVYDHLRLDEYGVGVPFTLGLAGIGLFLAAFPGLTMFWAETRYGQVGIITLLVLSVVLLMAAAYTYSAVDTTEWKLTKEEDGP